MTTRRKFLTALCAILAPIILVAAIMVASNPTTLVASSHREAPMISRDAFADNTDTYVFIPQGSTSRLVMVGSWIPFEGPEGGPNYWAWDDNVLYDLHVDIDGNATSDVTYTLSSRLSVLNPNTFLYNTGPISSLNDPDWNFRQSISVTEQFAPGFQPTGGTLRNLVANQLTAPVNIGNKSTPNYASLMMQAVYNYTDPGNSDQIKVFGGQTDDAFWVDLQVFDLLTLRGQAPPVGYTTPPGNNAPVDSVSGFNVHSLVIELPISRLVRNNQPVLGVWANSRRATMTVLGHDGSPNVTYSQVSRLGMPLVNEAVLPLGLKDAFNTLRPDQDLSVYSLLQESVEDPELGNLLCGLYGVPLPADTGADCDTDYTPGTPRSGRGDIFDIFLQGMVLANPFTINTAGGPVTLPAGFNVNRPPGAVPSEMIRINTGISGNLCSPSPSRLGVLGGDACGFPNGRRLTDDVVEIELAAVAGAAYQALDGRDAGFSFNGALLNVLDDNVDTNDQVFNASFPYMATAQSGQTHCHQNPGQVPPCPTVPTALSVAGFGLVQGGAPLVPAAAALVSMLSVGAWTAYRRRRSR